MAISSLCFKAVSAVLCIDHSRVYVTGESNGGMLAHYLVQSLPGARFFGMGLGHLGLGAPTDVIYIHVWLVV